MSQTPEGSVESSTADDHYWLDRYVFKLIFLLIMSAGFLIMLWGGLILAGNYLFFGTQFGGSGTGLLEGLLTMLVGAFIFRAGVRAEL